VGVTLAFSVFRSQFKNLFIVTLLALGGLLSCCAGGLGSSGPSNFSPNLLNGDQGLSNSETPTQNQSGETTVSGSYPSGQPTQVSAGKGHPHTDETSPPPKETPSDPEISGDEDPPEGVDRPVKGCRHWEDDDCRGSLQKFDTSL
jgi:hypothetical protein